MEYLDLFHDFLILIFLGERKPLISSMMAWGRITKILLAIFSLPTVPRVFNQEKKGEASVLVSCFGAILNNDEKREAIQKHIKEFCEDPVGQEGF